MPCLDIASQKLDFLKSKDFELENRVKKLTCKDSKIKSFFEIFSELRFLEI